MVIHDDRRIRAERLHGYFDLQLRFAQRVSEIGSLPFADTVAHYTNFHRRFGLGRLQGAPSSAEWTRFIDQLSLRNTHDRRVEWTQAFFLHARR